MVSVWKPNWVRESFTNWDSRTVLQIIQSTNINNWFVLSFGLPCDYFYYVTHSLHFKRMRNVLRSYFFLLLFVFSSWKRFLFRWASNKRPKRHTFYSKYLYNEGVCLFAMLATSINPPFCRLRISYGNQRSLSISEAPIGRNGFSQHCIQRDTWHNSPIGACSI